jgi:hypothetical protein
MTTITRDTLGDKALIFFRDVLRQNLTDTQTPARAGSVWIFKAIPDKLSDSTDFPLVSIDEAGITRKSISFTRTRFQNTLSFTVTLWCATIGDRDTVGDQIAVILSDPAMTDGTDSIAAKQLHYINVDWRNIDENRIAGYPEIVRSRRLTFEFQYGGS